MLISFFPKAVSAQESKDNSDVVIVEETKVNSIEKEKEKEDKKEDESIQSFEEESKNGNDDEQSEKKVKTTFLRSANSPNYVGEVTFVGQWVAESSKKEDEVRSFNSASDKLGAPKANPGLLRGLAKIFLGWSDKAPTKDGKLVEGSRLFSPYDTVGTAFPNGIKDGDKLYGVYFSLNKPDSPLGGYLELLDLMRGINSTLLNENKVYIDKNRLPESILPNTKLVEYNDELNSINVIDQFKESDNKNTINEIILESELETNKLISMLMYKNPIGSNALKPILSRNYDGNSFNTKALKEADYTYMDMVIKFDPNITLPEKLYLEFDGYAWRPLYVMNSDREVLEIFNPNTDNSLGNDKSAFSSLINSNSSKVLFSVKNPYENMDDGSGKEKEFIIRVILRHGKNEKIPEEIVVGTEGRSIAEEITKNVKLKVVDKSELKKIFPTLSEEELNSKVVRINNFKSKESAENEKKYKVHGYIEGYAVADAGEVSLPIFGPYKLRGGAKFNKTLSNSVNVGYTGLYNVSYTFINETSNENLPNEVLDLQPKDEFNLGKDSVINLQKFSDVAVSDGIWKFKKWSYLNKTNPNGEMIDISEESITITDSDYDLVGVWVFEKKSNSDSNIVPPTNSNPQPNKPETDTQSNTGKRENTVEEVREITNDKEKVSKKPQSKTKLPKTSLGFDNSFLVVVSMLSGVIISHKKRKR